MIKKIIIKKDILWKGVIKDLFEDFMYFFYEKEAKQIDFEKEVIFMDKELDKIYPIADQKDRRADLLVKVHLKTGEPCWLLIHIEVQGYVDPFFAKRMFQMNYRAYELLNIETIGFAILTDNDATFHPTSYEYGRWGSQMRYKFRTYKLLEKNPKMYKDSKNPFAAVMKTAWHGLKKYGLKTDEERLKMKVVLVKELLKMGHDKEKIKTVFDFIEFYVYFDDKKFYNKFEKELNTITNNNQQDMTLREAILEEYRKVGREEGIEEGIEKGIEKGVEEGLEKKERIGITNMLKKGFDIEIIVDLLEVTEKQVLAIKAELKENGELLK